MRPISIAFLMNGAKPPRGAELGVLDTVLSLRRDVFEPSLIYAEQGEIVSQLQREGIETHRIKLPAAVTGLHLRQVSLLSPSVTFRVPWLALQSGAVRAITSILRTRKIDVVYCCDNLSKAIGGLAARRAHIPAIGRCDDWLPSNLLGWTLRVLHVVALDEIHAVSHAVCDSLAAWPPARRKTVVIHNGVDTRRFDPDRVAPVVKGPETFVIAIIGVLEHNKAHDVLFRAVAALPDSGGKVEVWCIGEGPKESALRELASALDLSDCVKFLGFRNDIPELLGAADVAVMPSRFFESFGKVLVEAMAMKRPVIGTRVGGMRELVEDGVNGFLITPGSVDEMTDALRALIVNPALRRAMGVKGRERVLRHFSLERLHERFEERVLALIHDRASRAHAAV